MLNGGGRKLEHDRAAALAARVAVRRLVEGLAAPVRREHPRLAEADVGPGREDHVHARRDRNAAPALRQ